MMKIDSPTFTQRRAQSIVGTDLRNSANFQAVMQAQREQKYDTFRKSANVDASKIMEAAAADQINPGDTTLVKLAKLKTIAANTDFSGMTYPEIYTSLWQSYDAAFGGNFSAIQYALGNSNEVNAINGQFDNEYICYVRIPLQNQIYKETGYVEGTPEYYEVLDSYIGKEHNFASIALGYGGMSYEEKEAAIYDKYAGKNTLRDFLNMQGELFKTGVLDYNIGHYAVSDYFNILDRKLEEYFFPNESMNNLEPTQEQWNAIYDQEFDAKAFLGELRKNIENIIFANYDFDIQGTLLNGIDYMLEMIEQRE